jgi:hypothetical protein
MKTMVMGLAAAALIANGIGCDNEVTCEDACDAKADCDDAGDLDSCEAECSRTQGFYEMTGCAEHFDDILACVDEDACGERCEPSDAARDCVAAYCVDHEDACAPYFDPMEGE